MGTSYEHINSKLFSKLLSKFWLRCCPNFVESVLCQNKTLSIIVLPKFIAKFASFIKKHFSFLYFVDAIAVDFPGKLERFSIFYIVRQLKTRVLNFIDKKLQILIVAWTGERDLFPSLSNVFKGCIWSEREIFDLYGVYFSEHSDFRRILTDYGFLGFPFRKDFPLTGFFETRFDDSYQRVVSESVELAQEFRLFDFSNPWS